MTDHRYPLPGGKIELTTRRQWLSSMIRGARLFGPSYQRLMRAANSGDRAAMHSAQRRWARSATSALDLTIATDGLHHIKANQPYVVAPLHEGFADLLAIARLPLDMVFTAAQELFEWEYLGPYLRVTDQPAMSRTNGLAAFRTVLRSGKAASARGESLVIFPQGTILGIETAFTGGAFRAARHLDMPVLPVVLTGSSSVWDYPFDRELHFDQTIRLEVLAPVEPHQAVERASDLEREMKERALRATPGPRHFVPERDGWWDEYRYEIDESFPEVAMAVAEHRAAHLMKK